MDEQDMVFDMETDTGDGIDDSFFGDLMPVFNIVSPGGGSPKNHSPPASPSQTLNEDGHGGHAGGGGGALGGQRSTRPMFVIGEQEENTQHSLLQQPLAMGFYVSTATPGPLPKWFSSSCPHREKSCPICFKVSYLLSIYKFIKSW